MDQSAYDDKLPTLRQLCDDLVLLRRITARAAAVPGLGSAASPKAMAAYADHLTTTCAELLQDNSDLMRVDVGDIDALADEVGPLPWRDSP